MLVAGCFLLRDCGLHLRLIHKQKPKKKKELAIIQISTLGLFNTLYTKSVLNFFFKITLLQGGTEQQKYTVNFKFVNYNLITTNEQN